MLEAAVVHILLTWNPMLSKCYESNRQNGGTVVKVIAFIDDVIIDTRVHGLARHFNHFSVEHWSQYGGSYPGDEQMKHSSISITLNSTLS